MISPCSFLFVFALCRAVQDEDEGGAVDVEEHCRAVETTAAWGGQPELTALVQVGGRVARVTVAVIKRSCPG